MTSKRGRQGVTRAKPAPPTPAEASVIEPDLQVFVRPETPLATVTQLPVSPGKDRMSSLLERLELLESGLAAVGERLDRVSPPDVRLVEAHDDPARMTPWNDRHSQAIARGEHDGVTASGIDSPDYLPDEVFLKLQRTVADRLRKSE
jgi:hypothetical protein